MAAARRRRLWRASAALLAGGALAMAVAACGGGASAPPATYTVGGSVTGLTSSGLVLANGTDSLPVSANASSFILRGR